MLPSPVEKDGAVEYMGEGLLLSQAFNLYKSNVIAFRNQSHKTEEHHYQTLKNLVLFLGGDIPAGELTFEHVRDWKIGMEKKNRSSATIRGYLIRLRVVLQYLRLKGYDVLDPVMVPLPKRIDAIPAVLSPGEVSKLIEASHNVHNRFNSAKNKAIISLLYSTGLRVAELCALNIKDVEEDFFTLIGKGGKSRLCFIDARSRGLLVAYLTLRRDNDPALFITDLTKRRMTPGNVQEVFRRARKKAGFDWPIHPHTIRHSYATNLMKNGIDLYQLMKLMGHSSLQTTQVYLHLHDKHLKADFEKYHTI